VQFSRDLREGVASGEITVSFRLWRRAQVRVAGRYSVGSVQIEVDSIELMPFQAITADDIRQSGERDRESLRQRAAHAGPIAEDTLLHRVEFHALRRLDDVDASA
jgi:hypothetical protein